MTVVRIVADDLTGALDTAAPFAAMTGPLPVLWDTPSHPTGGGSFALDSETRDAKELRLDWLEGFRGADLAYKKIDSLLRGRTVDEIAACFEAGLFASGVIAPAFPAQQRITRAGRQYWRARPERRLAAGRLRPHGGAAATRPADPPGVVGQRSLGIGLFFV